MGKHSLEVVVYNAVRMEILDAIEDRAWKSARDESPKSESRL